MKQQDRDGLIPQLLISRQASRLYKECHTPLLPHTTACQLFSTPFFTAIFTASFHTTFSRDGCSEQHCEMHHTVHQQLLAVSPPVLAVN
jgi:hypothetical protein